MATLLLKAWLNSRIDDIKTAQTNVGLTATTTTLNETVADGSSSGAINQLIDLVSSLSSNTYLKHSTLWSNGALTDVSEQTIIDDDKRSQIEALTTDLSKICAHYSYELVTKCETHNASNHTFAFNSSNRTSFSFNASNHTFAFNTQGSCGFNSGNTTFSFDGFTTCSFYSTNGGTCGYHGNEPYAQNSPGFTQNSGNGSGFFQYYHVTSFNAYTQGFSSNTNSAHKSPESAAFSFNGTNSGFGFNATNFGCSQESFICGILSHGENSNNISFTQFSGNTGFSDSYFDTCAQNSGNTTFSQTQSSSFNQNSANAVFTWNSGNATFSENSANFTQFFNYSFTVRTDGTVISNSLLSPTGA